jgi:predicted nucleotidyltransferase component of viral defense system
MSELITVEGLMIFLINKLSEKFPQSAILKGGMTLRLLDCPRLTNDIDYIFIPYKSKNEIVKDLLAVLDEIDGLEYTYNLNSKCLRIRLKYGDLATQIEANVAKECKTTSISTAGIAEQYGMLGRVIQMVSYPVSMANKFAAWNERLLMRDLYDLYFYYSMVMVMPDMDILEKRLNKVASTPRNMNPKSMTLKQLISKLRNKLVSLGANDLQELVDYLPDYRLKGLETKIRVQLLQLCDDLESITN